MSVMRTTAVRWRLRTVNRMQAERGLREHIHCGIGIIDAAHSVNVLSEEC